MFVQEEKDCYSSLPGSEADRTTTEVWTEGTMEIEQCSGRLEWLDPMPREALETVLKSSLFPCGMDVCADQSGLPIDII